MPDVPRKRGRLIPRLVEVISSAAAWRQMELRAATTQEGQQQEGAAMTRDKKTVEPPPRSLLASEGRGLLDIPALLVAAPFLATAPRGQPHPVVVLPGLGADDG